MRNVLVCSTTDLALDIAVSHKYAVSLERMFIFLEVLVYTSFFFLKLVP